MFDKVVFGAALVLAACGGAPPASAPVVVAPSHVAPPPPPTHTVKIDVGTHPAQAFYTQPGRLVVASDGRLALVDSDAFRAIGAPKTLSSEVLEDHVDPVNHTVSRDVESARWAWVHGQLVGVVDVGGLGGAGPRGVGLWQPATETLPAYMSGVFGFYCIPIGVTADGTWFATIGCDGKDPGKPLLQVFASDTRALVATPADDAIRGVVSTSGAQLAFTTKTHGLGVYDIASQRVTWLPAPNLDSVYHLALDGAHGRVVAIDSDNHVDVWDVAHATRTSLMVQGALAQFSPDGTRLAVAGRDGLVLVDTATWRQVVATVKIPFSWEPDAIAWAPDGSQVAVVIGDQVVFVDLAARHDAPADDAAWASLHRLPPPTPGVPPPIGHDGLIEGHVTLAGKPLVGAEVKLIAHHQEWPDARALPAPTAKTGKDGAFRIEHAPQITWQVIVEAPGTTIYGFVADLREQQTVKADVAVEKAVTIAGRVLGPDRKPAKDVRLTHYHYDGTIDTDEHTRPDGTFVIDHLRPEQVPSYIPDPHTFEVVFRRGDGAVRSQRFDISKAGRIPAPMTLLAATDPHVVRVHVVDKAGAAVRDAGVILDESRVVPTDAKGDASLDVMDRKRVTIRVRSTSGYSMPVTVDLPQQAPLAVTLTP